MRLSAYTKPGPWTCGAWTALTKPSADRDDRPVHARPVGVHERDVARAQQQREHLRLDEQVALGEHEVPVGDVDRLQRQRQRDDVVGRGVVRVLEEPQPAVGEAVEEIGLDIVCAVPGDDGDPAHPDAVQALDDALEDRRLADRQERLVRLVGQGPHAARASRREDHRLKLRHAPAGGGSPRRSRRHAASAPGSRAAIVAACAQRAS